MEGPVQINQILGQALGSKNLHSSGLYYSDEAKDHGFKFDIPEPAPDTCQFCKKELRYRGMKHLTRDSIWRWLKPERCNCEKAIEYWKQYDSEQDRIRLEQEELSRKSVMSEKIEKLFRQSRMGDRFITRTFEKYDLSDANKKPFMAAKKYADNFETYKKEGIGIIFTGPYGTGKTHLAAAIAIELMNRGIPVIFGTLINLLGKLKETYGDENKDEADILDLYKSVDLLVIDDLGKERPSEWVLEKLYSIINERYENNRPIIITSNYTHETLINRLSVKNNFETAEAIVSRLYEICRGIILDGQDHRKL